MLDFIVIYAFGFIFNMNSLIKRKIEETIISFLAVCVSLSF